MRTSTPVLLIVPSLVRAGAETQVVSLANGLAQRGYEVHLASFGAALDQLDRVDRSRVRFYALRREGRFGLGLARQLARLMREHRYAVIHCTLQISLFYGFLARCLSRHKAPLIAALHTTLNLSPREERFDRWLYRPLLRGCAHVMFVCQAQARYWCERFPELAPRAVVIYNGIDAERFKPSDAQCQKGVELRHRLGVSARAPIVLCVARFRPEKGHGLLIEAMSRLDADGDPAVLLLAGEGPERARIEAQIARFGLESRVHLLGDVADPRPLYAAARVSVLASTSVETFSMAMLESLSMATPMVATDIGGMGEAVSTGRTGWLVPPGDVAALTDALAAAVEAEEATRALGVAGRERVLEQFTVEAMVDATAQRLRALAPACAPQSDGVVS